MQRYLSFALFAALIATTAAAGPTTNSVVSQTLSDLGGQDVFEKLGVLKMEVSEIEKIPNGDTNRSKYTAYVDTTLENSRLELPGDIIVVRNGATGWAIVKGNFDSRQNSPRMAAAMNNQKLFPLLLPYTFDRAPLRFSKNVGEATFQGEPSWKFSVSFPELFFQTPMIAKIWEVYVSKADATKIAARFLPVAEYQEAQPEGMQYSPLRWTKVEDVSLPAEVLIQGVDAKGMATKHTRKVTITYEIVKSPDPKLFVAPKIEDAPAQP